MSIVIPAYNAGKYIKECLGAAIGQTYKNLEILVVDDGSTDDTIAICREYEQRDSRVRLIENAHGGVSKSRNTGIEQSSGEYIVFMDADDYPEADMIEEYLKAWEKKEWENGAGENPSFVLCGMFDDNRFNANVSDTVQMLEVSRGFVPDKEYLLERNMIATLCWLKLFNFVTNKCYSLSKIKEKNLRFCEEIQIGEDLLFNLDYLKAVDGNIGMINRPLYHYVKREKTTLSVSYYENAIEHTKFVYGKLIEFAKVQEGFREDDLAVLESILLTDWTSRLTGLYEDNTGRWSCRGKKCRVHQEIQSREFQTLLKRVYQNKKITRLRYYSLRTKVFGIFYFLRGIYQMLKA